MPHLTEGLLHAHLDGALGPDQRLEWADAEAHLEVCDDCRRRLDEVAELRDAASALLAAAAPAPSRARPDFDELVARAEARRAESAPSARSTGRVGRPWWRMPAKLAWAASLVVAVGAGWIGRQLVVEQGLDGPRVTAEQDGTMGRAEPAEGVALDDVRDGATPDEARARQDAAEAPATPEAVSRFRAEQDAAVRQAVRPEAERVQEKAEARMDADAEAGADAIRMEALTVQAADAGAPGAARCYAVSPELGDGEDAAVDGRLETLRLAADGTASLRLEGRPMVGFWEQARGDTLRLRISDGAEWREVALIEAEDGVRGDAELEAATCP